MKLSQAGATLLKIEQVAFERAMEPLLDRVIWERGDLTLQMDTMTIHNSFRFETEEEESEERGRQKRPLEVAASLQFVCAQAFVRASGRQSVRIPLCCPLPLLIRSHLSRVSQSHRALLFLDRRGSQCPQECISKTILPAKRGTMACNSKLKIPCIRMLEWAVVHSCMRGRATRTAC